MKKHLLAVFMFLLAMANIQAQTTILDFESAASSTVFQYFGSNLEGSLSEVITNPNPSTINTSSMVGKYVKPAVAEVWAGCFSNPAPSVAVDLLANGKISVKVHMDHIGNLALKLENSTNGGTNWVTSVANTKVNEWEELIFDATAPSLEDPNVTANGFTYTNVVLFFDFGANGTGTDVTSYFDDIVALPNPPSMNTTILDFETAETGTTFQYFGSNLEATLTESIPNPNPSGINTSATVLKYVKPAVSEVWAGAFSNPNPTTPVDFTNGGQICVKVHMDHIGELALKLEGSTSGMPNWVTKVANTKINEWEEICFDASVPSFETPFGPASGVYSTIVLFYDFGVAGTGTDVTSYLDDVVVKPSAGPVLRTVSFKVDMNSYSANFNQVYVSGSFNSWSGDANPLADADLDGIWEGSIIVPNGLYEYKVTLDNWAAQEQFGGFEECTIRDPSGQFVNRRLTVSDNIDVPKHCFNSCYACGDEVKLTFLLGMGDVVPSPDGVWLCGGGNFDVPGGKYKMNGPNANGVFDIVVPRQKGFSSFYAFANGACPDFSCKENLAGQACGDPNNFNDRFLAQTNEDVTNATCYEACFTNVLCVSSLNSLISDATLFSIIGNPSTNGTTVIEFNKSNIEDTNVVLTNAIGQTLGQWNVAGGTSIFEIETAGYTAGMYFITVRTNERFYTQKLVR